MPDKKPIPTPKGKLAKKPAATPATPSDRTGIIAAVKTPLGFFALVVLAVEAILGATTVLSKLSEAHQFIVVMLMICILVLMILVVAGIALFKPEALSPEMGEIALKAAEAEREAKQALDASTQLQSVISSPAFQSGIRQIVRDEMDAGKRSISAKQEDER